MGALIDGVRAEAAGAWPLHDSPPTFAELWADRIPDIDDVPGQSRILQVAWAVWNHIAVGVTAVGYTALWLVQHPARAALAAAILAPIIIAIATAATG